MFRSRIAQQLPETEPRDPQRTEYVEDRRPNLGGTDQQAAEEEAEDGAAQRPARPYDRQRDSVGRGDPVLVHGVHGGEDDSFEETRQNSQCYQHAPVFVLQEDDARDHQSTNRAPQNCQAEDVLVG